MSLDATPSEGAISIEQATSLLSAPAEAAPVEAAPAEVVDDQDEASTTPEAETDAGPEEDSGEGEAEEIEAADEQPIVEAPAWWPADQKEAFAKADPVLKQAIAEAEAGRETYYGKLREETVAEKKKAETEGQNYHNVLGALANVVPQWQQLFQSQEQQFQAKWANVDWVACSADYPAETYNRWRAEYEADEKFVKYQQTALQQAQQQATQATEQARQKFLAEEGEKLARLRPELADPKEGQTRKTGLINYLLEQGFAADQLKDLPAAAINTAWKAQQYDLAKANLAAKPRPTPVPQRGNVRPTAAAETRTSQQRSIEQITARLAKSGSIDDAVALLQAQRK